MRRSPSKPAVLLALLLAGLALAGCANADGSLPRLAGGAPAGSTGFGGGYAGAGAGFSNLNTKATPF